MSELFCRDRDSVYICLNAICNLKCSYCFINKNEKLKKIDKIIENSSKTNYYIETIKKIYTDRNILRSIDIWGGEPFLSLERIYYTYKELLKIYPSLNRMSFSTNLTVDNFIEKLNGLFEIQKEYPDRKFVISLQISIDGPKYITDKYRGAGTTNKIINNFNRIISEVPDIIPKNVSLEMHLKQTLTSEEFIDMSNYEYMLDYFKFFENNFYEKVYKLNHSNISIVPTIYNLATPSHHTKEDGVLFANVCKTAQKINENIKRYKVLKYYKNTIPFRRSNFDNLNRSVNNGGLSLCGGTCGLGRNVIGILPNNMVTACHRSFTSCIDDYYNSIIIQDNLKISEKPFRLKESQTVFDIEYLPIFTDKINSYYEQKSKHTISSLVILIQMLALSDQIEEKYKSPKEAIRGARFIAVYNSLCLHDNEAETGTFSLVHTGLIKLFLNGAMEYIMGEGNFDGL